MTPETKSELALGISLAALLWTVFKDLYGHLIDRGRLRFDEPFCIVEDPQEPVDKLITPVTNVGRRPIRLVEVETVRSVGTFRSESWWSFGGGPDWPKELKEGERLDYSISLEWAIDNRIDKLIFHDHFRRRWAVRISGLRRRMEQERLPRRKRKKTQ